MNRQHILLKTLPVAAVVAFITTRLVRGWTGSETFLCGETDCVFDSGSAWLPTGATVIGPFIAVLGFMFTRRLHYRDRLGPFSHRAIPDSEQILEVLGVLGAGALTYWVLHNGPMTDAVDIGSLSSLAADILGENDVPSPFVPSRRTWFAIGAILGAPFAFSLGSMLGREWYGRKRRQAEGRLATTEPAGDDLAEGDYPVEDDDSSEETVDNDSGEEMVDNDDVDEIAD